MGKQKGGAHKIQLTLSVYLAVYFACKSKRWWFLSGMLLFFFFMCYSNMFPLLFNDCYKGTELERAVGSFFGFHVLIWKWNCLWEASLASFEFWMYLCIQILFPWCSHEKAVLAWTLPMVGSIIVYALKCAPFDAWI